MASTFDGLVSALDDELGDSTVLMVGGQVLRQHGRRDQARRISLVRQSGVLRFSTARGQRFVREETIGVAVSAESEEAVDDLFNAFMLALFAISGPDALVDSTTYEWGQRDSQGGGHTARQTVLEAQIVVRLKVAKPAETEAEVEQVDATLTELGEDESLVTT